MQVQSAQTNQYRMQMQINANKSVHLSDNNNSFALWILEMVHCTVRP